MKVVRLIKAYQMYQAGETAGFSDALAQKLIASGTAVDPIEEAEAKAAADEKAAADAKVAADAKAAVGAKGQEEADAKAKDDADAKANPAGKKG